MKNKFEWRHFYFCTFHEAQVCPHPALSHRSPSLLPSKTVSRSNAKKHKQDLFCEEQFHKAKLSCSRLLWRTCFKITVFMFTFCLKNKVQKTLRVQHRCGVGLFEVALLDWTCLSLPCLIELAVSAWICFVCLSLPIWLGCFGCSVVVWFS